MKILNTSTITGPNIYHDLSVLIINMHLEKLTEIKSSDIEQCYGRITSLLPGLKQEICPTSLAHMVEEIAIELSQLAGIGVNFGRTYYEGDPGAYKIVVRNVNEEAMKFLLNSAVEIVQYASEGMSFDLDACLNHARYLVRKTELGPLAGAVITAAREKNVPWKLLNSEGLIQLGHGKFRQFFQTARTERTSDIAVQMAKNKALTKKILEGASILLSEEKVDQSVMIVGGRLIGEVHPEIKNMCERASRIMGLDICSFDLGHDGTIVDVHTGANIPFQNILNIKNNREIGTAIVNHLFPYNINGRIPIVSISGANGKTTVGELIAHVASEEGKSIGRSAGDLMDPIIEVAVIENARNKIIQNGLGYDWSDVGIITNVPLNQLGAERLVAERVRPGGTIVLNADSPELVNYRDELREELLNRKVVYFSLSSSNRVVLDHLEDGGHAYFLRNGEIIEALGYDESIVFNIEQVPLTLKGTALFHVANVLAAVAGAHAMGIDDETILTGLMNFGQRKVKGRPNLFHLGEGHLLADYGHTPDAIMSVGEMGRKWDVTKTTAIIASPKLRSNELIKQLGTAAAWVFDKIIVRDPLMAEAARDEGPDVECEIVSDGREGLHSAFTQMKEKELIVFFYEDYNEIDPLLSEFQLKPVVDSERSFFHKTTHSTSTENEEGPQYSS